MPDKIGEPSSEHESFLDQSIAGLAQDGKIICVRLALFAEMVKGKPWTSATLREVGGTEGIGSTFLEETFSTSTAPPEHRLHQKAAQPVLKALLPESGADIKGQMRSRQELLEASGYANRPRDFDDLIRILDPELRLITPTDPKGSDDDQSGTKPEGQYYQLAHDYLVHSLRDWLTRKQRETRKGRAELRLAERSASWNDKPDHRNLPSPSEWANIRLLTNNKGWTEPQRRMMQRAGRVHGVRGALSFALLTAIILAGIAFRRQVIENQSSIHAAGLVRRVLEADTPQVPVIVEAMRDYRKWVGPSLRSELDKRSGNLRQELHASLALLPVDATQVDYLFNRLLKATPIELPVLRDALKTHQSALTPKLWTVLESAKPGDDALLPAASALAIYDTDNAKWEAQGGKVAQALVSVNSIYLGPWLEALRPVRGKLTAPIVLIFQHKNTESVYTQATNILTDYASDDPNLIANLLMDSDAKAYLSFFPVAERQAEKTLRLFQSELAKRATYSWNDPSLDSSWTKPDAALVSRIESAQGILDERFAFCQTMPVDEFLTTAEALRKSGYRPIRFRPYVDEELIRVAAVWTRDGRNWRISSSLSAEQVREEDERNKKDKFLPVEFAGYVSLEKDGKPADHYAGLWVEKSGDDDAQLYVGTTADEADEFQDKLKDTKLIPRTLHAMIGAEGRTRYCGVWGKPPGAAVTGQTYREQFEGNFEQNQARLSDQLLVDITVSGASKPQPTRERALADLQRADKKLKTKPNDLDARLSRALANLRLGENQKALDDLQVVIGKNPEAISAKRNNVIALARLAKKLDALTELAKFQKEVTTESSKLYLAVVVAAELGKGADKAFGTLEAAIKKQPKDSEIRYDAARAFSLASRAVSRSDKAKGCQLAERCLELLSEAIKNDDADYGKMDEDGDLDPIREDPAFAEIMKAGHPDRRYAAVWNGDVSFEATSIYGLDPAAQLRKCRELMDQGYRPVSWSAIQTASGEPLITSSVWHRPTVQEEVKDRLAHRQARAAIALVRMGKTEEFPMLRHSADPRLRSFIVNWLSPLGADPKLIVSELDLIDPKAKPTPAQGQQAMDAILFHPETSMRRALILALGTYGTDGLSLSERQPLVRKLLDLYVDDPDSGIHGAAEWTLRQWKQQEKLQAADAELMKVKDRGDRRWFVNSQGQTFAVIEGPIEFRMGSPPTEPDHQIDETQHRKVIARRFAIAAREVTVEQHQRFVKTNPQFAVDPSTVARYSPDSAGPTIGDSWYAAAAYCNWLSEQEGLPRHQWCYVPNQGGAYDDRMTIPADVLKRTGYRLPTDAEWEYSCRSGSITSRYYGVSTDLLGKYARYQANSQEHAWPGGSLLPNELGLFDMLGNVFEWVQDRAKRPDQTNDAIDIAETVDIKSHRLFRGGSFNYHPAIVRSAFLNGYAPSSSLTNVGFRLARTYP